MMFDFGHAVWNPAVWLIALVLLTAGSVWLRSRGRKDYKKDTAQTDVFISGTEVAAPEQRHIAARNIYWGFFSALQGFFRFITRPHTGIINDYVLWFVIVLVAAILILVLV